MILKRSENAVSNSALLKCTVSNSTISPPGLLLLALVLAAGDGLPAGSPPCVVRVADGGFVCDGEPFPVVGLNCYYLMVYGAEASLRPAIDEVLEKARILGATVVRTWAFNDGAGQWNALQRTPGVYDEHVFVGLDYAIKKAAEEGLRLLMPLVNNWDDYGGMMQYVNWSPTASSHDDFYTDADARRWYRDHVSRVLNRVNTFTGVAYKNDPTIFGWELANEPRARDKGAAVLNGWIAEMAAHVKSIDPAHILSTGSEGYYGPSGPAHNPRSWMGNEGVDFQANHLDANIDFASFHTYPDLWSISKSEALAWVRDHYADARSLLGKPALMGEFGKFQPVAARNEYFLGFYDELLASLAPGTSSGGALLWILYHDSYNDYDGFGVYYPAALHATTTALIHSKSEAVKDRVALPPPSPSFRRADFNCDGGLGLADPLDTLNAMFAGGAPSCCWDAADSNDDGEVDVSDALYSLLYLFLEASPPPAPFPACGGDGGVDEPDLGCADYAVCS